MRLTIPTNNLLVINLHYYINHTKEATENDKLLWQKSQNTSEIFITKEARSYNCQLIVIIPQKKNSLPMQNPENQTQGFVQNITRELLGASTMQLIKLA